MLTIRPGRWPDDIALLAGLDTSFTADRIYRVDRDEFGFTLINASRHHDALGSGDGEVSLR